MAYQNDATDVKQLRLYLKQGNESEYSLWQESQEAASDRIKSYWNPSIALGNSGRGRYSFYFSKKDSNGNWSDYPAHSLDVYRDRTHSQTYHGKQAWTSAAATGDFVSSAEVVDSKAISSCHIGETVYATMQNCAGCKDTLSDAKALRLYLKKPGEDSFTQVERKVSAEGDYTSYYSVPYTFTELGTYEMYFVTEFWKGDSYSFESSKRTLTVEPAKAAIIGPSSYSKNYGAADFVLDFKAPVFCNCSSSNPNVADVYYSDAKGQYMVRIKDVGTATVTITSEESDKYIQQSKKVTIKVAPKKPVLKYKKLSSVKGKIYWNRVPGATSYKIYKYNSKTKKYAYLSTKRTNYVTVTSKKKKAMKFKVKAVRKGVYSPYSEIKKITLGK